MQVSVIVPVYNEEREIGQCLDALTDQDYPDERYEIIAVNDGSTDNTAFVIGRYNNVRLINLGKNMGRIAARLEGARNAKYDMLLFIDSRCLAASDLLSALDHISYQPVMAGIAPGTSHESRKSSYERIMDLFRLRYYPSEAREEKEYWINEDNFDRAPKGTTCLFISRELFMNCQPEDRGPHVNDDTRILREVVRHKPMLRHQDVRIEYQARSEFGNSLKHIFYRGPRFQDYYLSPGGIYRKYFIACVITGLLLIIAGIIFPRVWLVYALAFVFGMFGVSFYLSRNARDFFLVLLYFPLIAGTFIAGVLYGKIRVWFLSARKHLLRSR